MIQTRDAVQVTSTVPTENKIAMSIRPEDMGKVMGILTDLYKNRLLAAIREYATNALDAIIDAGLDPTKHPVRITLPTALTPFLTIADSGVGLDEEGVMTYSQYGHSTKDTRNDVVGMLGLGCKAALTYTAQFTLTSVKDGTKRVVVISREEDGSASVTPLTTEPTDEPNGTEVKIAVSREDHQRAATLAADFFSFWQEGTVLVNGEQPKRFNGLRVTDDLYIIQHGGSRVVMGNVAYPAPELDDLCPMGNVVAYVPIGAVEFPPSRESLQECRKTDETLEKIRADFAVEVKKSIQREIDKATDPLEAIRFACEWDRYVPGGGILSNRHIGQTNDTPYTYRGQKITAFIESELWHEEPDRFTGKPTKVRTPFIVSDSSGSYRPGSSDERMKIPAMDWAGTVWVTGYTPGKFVAQHKHKLRMLAEQKKIDLDTVKRFIMVRGDLPTEAQQPGVAFIQPDRVLDWEDARKLRVQPVASRAGSFGRIPGSYDLFTEDGYESGVPGDKIRRNVPILYYNGNRWQGQRYLEVIGQNFPKFTLVLLQANRINKFCRIVPEAKLIRDALGEKRDEWVKSLSKDQRDALWLADNHVRDGLRRLDAGKVDDPALKRGIKLTSIDTKRLSDKRQSYIRAGVAVTVNSNMKDPLSKYPLFDTNVATLDHVYAYLNWHYAETK